MRLTSARQARDCDVRAKLRSGYFESSLDDARNQVVFSGLLRGARHSASLQVAILKALSSYPAGRASLAAMNADLAILCSSGQEWSQRTRRLVTCAPDLDILGHDPVLRDEACWQLTEAGSELLRLLEAEGAVRPAS